MRTQQIQSLLAPSLSTLEEMMVKDHHGRELVSKLYNGLIGVSSEISAHKLNAWRECTKAQSQTVNTHLKLLQDNWLMHAYMTLVKLNKFNQMCAKTVKRKRAHIFTICGDVLEKFWKEVKQCIEAVFAVKIHFSF